MNGRRTLLRHAWWICLLRAGVAAAGNDLLASTTPKPDAEFAGVQFAAEEMPAPESSAMHWQITNVTQWHANFTAPYTGANSLVPGSRNTETTDITLFAGVRLWKNGEAWINPEIDQGFGLSNTLGAAGFPSGEAYKIGANAPYLRLPRAFYRHVIALGGEAQAVDAGANQLAGSRQADNLTFAIGKFSVVDVFDTNAYAHDPRADFLNWSVVDAGAFDYAADSWGYTYGAAAEWSRDTWTVRAGVFDLSRIPNSKQPDTRFRQYELVAEIEERYQLAEHDGKLKLLVFVNRGRMGSYTDAVNVAALNGGTPDTAQVRQFASRPGVAINFEQEVRSGLGFFVRASLNDGRKEAFEFTEINRSLSAGFSLHGDMWGRHDDVLGLAGVINGLSTEARNYFAAGGLGILIGDGRLNYRPEKIAEAYYLLNLNSHLKFSVDYQYIADPAYNHDRGPVSIFAARIHAEF